MFSISGYWTITDLLIPDWMLASIYVGHEYALGLAELLQDLFIDFGGKISSKSSRGDD